MKRYKYVKVRVSETTPNEVFELYRANIRYDPDTGILSNIKTGTVYNKLSTKGYISSISIRFNNIEYGIISHRLAWFLYYSELPKSVLQIDHINGIKSDNRISNLRLCSNTENQRNTRIRGRIPFKGVCETWDKGKMKYAVSISIDGRKTISRFKSAEIAAQFYDSAARYYYKEFANCNFKEVFIEPKSIEELRVLKQSNYKHH